MFSKLNFRNDSNIIYWTIISIVVLLGIYIRFKGLGKWPLALDEYYIIKSSENILQYGLPQFPNGGYYVRGVLMQYLIAPLLPLGVKAEFAGRIFPLISNIIAIPALYLIAKRVGNKLIATIAVIIFSLSIWEIEFARFARMYAPFQSLFLWYVYFALLDFENKNFQNFKWMLTLSAISIFVYEGSIFLVLLNFVPFVLLRKFNSKYFILSVFVFTLSVFFNQFNFRTLNSAPILPIEALNNSTVELFSSPIKIPKVLLLYSFNEEFFMFLTPLIILTTIFLTWLLIKNLNNKNFYSIFSLIFLSLCALFNQFGLFILSTLLFLFWNFLNDDFTTRKNLVFLTLIFSINLLYWFIFGITTTKWYVLFNDFSSYSLGGVTKRLLVGFFSYPDNYISLLTYIKTLPILTIFSFIFLIGFFIFLFFKPNNQKKFKFLSGVLIFMSIMATIPTLLYDETRYTFFLVPILLVLVLYSVHNLFGRIIIKTKILNLSFSFLVLVTFLISADFNLYHLKNIDKSDVNYRMIYNNNYKKHLYRRWDIKTPIEFVKKSLKKEDLIIINENSLEYYLPRVDYFNVDYMHEAFVALSVERGKKERWSASKLIYKNENLENLIINRKTTIWYLVFPENWLINSGFYDKYNEYLVYEGIDGLIKVFKFPQKISN